MINKQWLQQKIAEMEEHRDLFPGDLDDDHASVLSAFRIALASLESEPVAYIIKDKTDRKEGHRGELSFRSVEQYYEEDINEHELTATPLYSAPPAPVVPDAMEPVLKDGEIIAYERHGERYSTVVGAAWNTCRAAMLQGAEPDFREISNSSTKHFRENAETSTKCWCHTCRPVTFADSRFVVCPDCGNKRCPHANDHRNACTGSNEPGKEGSAYPAAPQQEA